jgi:hypothetical protein
VVAEVGGAVRKAARPGGSIANERRNLGRNVDAVSDRRNDASPGGQ